MNMLPLMMAFPVQLFVVRVVRHDDFDTMMTAAPLARYAPFDASAIIRGAARDDAMQRRGARGMTMRNRPAALLSKAPGRAAHG